MFLFGSRYVCLLYDLYPDIAVELNVVKQNHPVARGLAVAQSAGVATGGGDYCAG